MKTRFNIILGVGALVLAAFYPLGTASHAQEPQKAENPPSEQAATAPPPPEIKKVEKAPEKPPAQALPAQKSGNRFFRRAMATYALRAEQKNHWKAARYLAKMARKYPDETVLQMWCARTALYCALRVEHGDTRMSLASQGEDCAARLVEKNPGDYEAGILLLRNQIANKEAAGIFSFFFYVEEARDRLEPMMKNYPTRYEAYQVLGSLYIKAVREPFSIGDVAKGISILEKGQAHARGDAEYYYELGVAYEAAGRLPEARVSYERCVDEGVARPELDWETTFFKELAKEKIK